jgi:hypothetical protein
MLTLLNDHVFQITGIKQRNSIGRRGEENLAFIFMRADCITDPERREEQQELTTAGRVLFIHSVYEFSILERQKKESYDDGEEKISRILHSSQSASPFTFSVRPGLYDFPSPPVFLVTT